VKKKEVKATEEVKAGDKIEDKEINNNVHRSKDHHNKEAARAITNSAATGHQETTGLQNKKGVK
jgi:hypothetical protein